MTRYAPLTALSGSMTVGHVAPYWLTKSRAGSGGSSVSTPTTVRPSAACWASLASSSGNSSRQGTHDGPQKLMRTGLPAKPARSNGAPSRVVPASAGAGSPIEAWAPVPCPERTNHTKPAPTATATSTATRMVRRGMDPVRLLDRGGPCHGRRMDDAQELVGAGGQRGHVIDLGVDAVEDLALECHASRGILDLDVVGCALVLVVERDLERLAGRCRERGFDEHDPLGLDLDVRGATGRWRSARGFAARPTRC